MIFFALIFFMIYRAGSEKMYEVKVDIGRNIEDTARESGAPKFDFENHWGLKIYELVDLKPEVVVRFSRPGFEIVATPLFSLTMYADAENNNNLAVESIQLQYNYRADSHAAAQAFVENIIKQFNRGKWRRHIRSICPAISGRSTYLDEKGNIYVVCPIDPSYRLAMEEWIKVMGPGGDYEWLGAGVLARLSIKFDDDSRGLTYNINLEFEDFAIKNRRTAAELARELTEGDKKGWNSSQNHIVSMEKNKVEIKLLEENAVRRGDPLVIRD